MTPDVRSLTLEEIEAQLRQLDEPAYRAKQLLEWLYVHRATNWDAMTNLPRSLREKLGQHFSLRCLELVSRQGSSDTTQKFLWRLKDGGLIESVLIPASPSLYGEPSDRHTLCVSTQLGCAYGCKFCASGLDGWKRHLTPDEIVEQVLAVERFEAAPSVCSSTVGSTRRNAAPPGVAPPKAVINNLVIMGMGEPLANYKHLLKALRILNAPWGGGIGARKITISTSGLVPQIRKLADEPFQFRLAISLHAGTDEVRNKIMPVNRKFPLETLVAACEFYHQRKGRMITLEYILIDGLNDHPDQTKSLAVIANRLEAKVNLIPYNQVDGLPWQRPSERVQEMFLASLKKLKVSATLRREKGHDIDAACGQLRLRTERDLRLQEGRPASA